MLNQRMQQRLIQKLSPQQVLVMKLLQEPVLSLEQRIKQEIEENPALEETSQEEEEEEKDFQSEEPVSESPETGEDDLSENADEHEEPETPSEDEFSYEDYLQDDEIPEYRLTAQNKSPDEEIREIPIASGTSFQEYLQNQVGLYDLNETQATIAYTIIGNLDDSGYLQRDVRSIANDLAFNQNINAEPEEVEEVLKVVQDFDPAGIAARNLQECLLLQLNRITEPTRSVELSIMIIKDYFQEFSKKHYDKILIRTHISEQDLKEAIEEIQKLNPKPGTSISEVSRENNYVVPDFIIISHDGDLELTLNSRNMPELSINRQYIEMLREYSTPGKKSTSAEKEAANFIKQKLDAAKGFIDAIKQRQDTLYTTMKTIMDYQRSYFLSGDETKLRPMILKDIATRINMDISTVSRVANSKYVQTPFGTFLLKSFFSESMQNVNGEEISTREIKKILKDCIESEDKSDPLTDDQLVEVLKEKGYNIARRTIAKYREQLSIPVARLRKEL
ncbi:MAG: RNA polymerase factor sigma-54 [Bacteroidota bacterium]|nr:RNA polymerase factor sigma-54 [Bacteroidota bacterium]